MGARLVATCKHVQDMGGPEGRGVALNEEHPISVLCYRLAKPQEVALLFIQGWR